MSRVIYIGIDDTDNLESVGTGKVARGMAARLTELGLGESLGVSRHQLLVHPEIKYTSHNSAKGLALKTDATISDLIQPCEEYLKSCWQNGSDPGLCLCEDEKICEEINEFGLRAEKELLTKSQAYGLAEKHSVYLKEFGGDGGGVIGAIAAVGLRSTGNNGRLVEVKGIRGLQGLVTVGEILQKSDIVAVQDNEGRVLGHEEIIDSLNWIRPSLIDWKPVLRVVRNCDHQSEAKWVPAERPFRDTGGKK
jgi:hypothetical protein